jgi:UDP-glucose 4-epimerase
MNVLVLGGSGFIGSYVCDALLDRGHAVSVLSHSNERFRQELETVEYHYKSIEDIAAVSQVLAGADCVVHLISSTVPSTSNLDPVADVRSNLLPTVKMMEMMRQLGPRRIIFLSSGGTVYGNPHTLPIREVDELNPICSYGVVKVSVEKYLRMYSELYDFQTTVIRPSNPYGPRQGRKGVQGLISAFLNCILEGRSLKVWGDGSVVRDYFYVADLANLCVACVEGGHTGIFNAGSGDGVSINELIHTIQKVCGVAGDVEYMQGRSFDVAATYLDIGKAQTEIGWAPTVSLEDGIDSHWTWLKSLKT